MKRIGGDGLDVGQRGLRPENRPGRARIGRGRTLALTAPPSAAAVRAAGFQGSRARDFEDFVAGDGGWTTVLRSLPDPGFREGLRRRLWRIHVLKRAHRGFERN
jgi:transposase